MSPKINWTLKALEQNFPISQVPLDELSAIVKEVKYQLHMNRDCKRVDVDTNKDKEVFTRISFLLNILWSLDFTQKWITVEKDEVYWKKARLHPKNGTRAIMGVSHKMRTYKKVRIMQVCLPEVVPVNSKGKPLYNDIFCDCIYISGSVWTLGCTSGNPYADSDNTFSPWDEPFLSYEKDKPRTKNYTERIKGTKPHLKRSK